jgi:hypothetical protein
VLMVSHRPFEPGQVKCRILQIDDSGVEVHE